MDKKRVAIYARVSTRDQRDRKTIEIQLNELKQYAESRGFMLSDKNFYVDDGISGTKGEDERPEFRRMMEDVRWKRIDVVLVWKFDRFARSVTQLANSLVEFEELEVDFISLKEQIDTSTSAGKFMFHVFSAFAEFERDLIRERVIAGIERAKQKGKRLGARPWKLIDEETKNLYIEEIVKLRNEGRNLQQIADAVGLSKSYTYQLLPTVLKSRRKMKHEPHSNNGDKIEENTGSVITSFQNRAFPNAVYKALLAILLCFTNHDFFRRRAYYSCRIAE